jgi:hypothetical protein
VLISAFALYLDLLRLNGVLEKLQVLSANFQQSKALWDGEYDSRMRIAKNKVDARLEAMKVGLLAAADEAEATADIAPAVACLTKGRRQLQCARNSMERVQRPKACVDAMGELSRLCLELRDLGDELDVDTRQLPVSTVWLYGH